MHKALLNKSQEGDTEEAMRVRTNSQGSSKVFISVLPEELPSGFLPDGKSKKKKKKAMEQGESEVIGDTRGSHI